MENDKQAHKNFT